MTETSSLGPYGLFAKWLINFRKPVAWAFFVLTVVAGLMATRIGIDSNLLNLLPENEPSAIALRQLHEEEGGVNLLTLAFAAEDDSKLTPFLDDLVQRLEALDGVQFALHTVDEDLAYRIGLLQLSPDDIRELTGRIKGALVMGPAINPFIAQKLMDLGPLAKRIEKAGDVSLFDSEGGSGRILVRPTGSSHDQKFSQVLMKDVERVLEESGYEQKGITLNWMGGPYRHNVEDVEGIRKDIVWTSGASACLVLLIISLAFRSFSAAFIVFIPIVVAGTWNLGLTWLVFKDVNTYTSFGTAILIGLGIDFAIHLVGRYREKRVAGMDVDDAIAEAWDTTGPPCTTAALTSAAGFLALATADFQGFSQLGILLASGLVLCLVCMLVLLPMLLRWLDHSPKLLLGSAMKPEYVSRSTYRLAPYGLMIAVVLTGIAGARIPKIDFEYDFSALRTDGLSYAELSDTERILARESYNPVIISYDDRETLASEQRRLEDLILTEQMPRFSKAISIENVLPSDQEQRVHALVKLKELMFDPNLRYLPPPIVMPLLGLRTWEPKLLQRSDIPISLLHLLGAGEEKHVRLLLFPTGNMWDLRETSALVEEVATKIPQKKVAGEYLSLGALFNLIKKDMPLIGGMAFLLVFALTVIDLRKAHWVAGAMGTLMAGLVWAGAAIEFYGIKLSMINVVGIPILLGIGVDVVIHLLHRLTEEGPGGVRRAISTTGVAALISTLTTMLSFSSLTLASNRGIRSLGMLVVIGLAAIFVAAAALLPLAWSAGWKITGQAPADQKPKGKEPAEAS